MSNIHQDVAASGIAPSDRDSATEIEEAVVRLLQSGSTYHRISQIVGITIIGVMQIAHRAGIVRSTPRINPPATNTSPELSSDELCAVLGAEEVQ